MRLSSLAASRKAFRHRGANRNTAGPLEYQAPATVRSHTQDIHADGVRRIYGYLAAADRKGMRSRPISSASVTATRIIVSAAPQKMSVRSVRPIVTHPGG